MTDSRVPILAVVLGRFYGIYFFYTNGGQLMADPGTPSVLFSVADFASPSDIQPLVDFIPKDRRIEPNEMYDKHQPPLELGRVLHTKMQSFTNEASLALQRTMGSLSSAHVKLPWPTEFRILSLHEIADILVPEEASPDGYDPALLYAIHTALLDQELDAFRALNQITRGKHVSYLYRVSPGSSIQSMVKVRKLIRDIMDVFGGKYPFQREDRPSKIGNDLWWFIVKARNVVKRSRSRRTWTDHGVLAPHHDRYTAHSNWSDEHKDYIRFIELWASDQFRPGSPMHSMGSSILRLTGMYRDAEQLNTSTGWTFLQELGWIPSWEVPTRHKFPLPGASVQPGGGYNRPDPGPYRDSVRDDIAAEYRKDWGSLKAYCIDASTTVLLDDAISIEPADKSGEYWIHVHSADPAAFIKPDSKLADFASIVAIDHYLPGYRYSMFPQDFNDEVVMKQLSLDNGRPCLTFSTRLNEAGEILDTNIQPGTLQNVVSISPDEVAKVCPCPDQARDEPSEECSLYVGPPQSGQFDSGRKMVTADDLSPDDKSNLQTMHRILSAVDAAWLKNGAVRHSRVTRSVEVMFDSRGDPTPKDCSPYDPSWPGDPAIKLSIGHQQNSPLVQRAMTLAGNTAAKWCHDRGIPVPYHTQPRALRSPAVMRAMADKINGFLDSEKPVPRALWELFIREVGPASLDVEPSPVLPMGLDMYTKVTSPLRRFPDCMTHWQIHAYLSSNRGQDTANPPGAAAAALPWSRDALRAKIDDLRLPVHISRTLSNLGSQTWAYQAFLRAWKFGEAKIPARFNFTVRDLYEYRVHGDLGFMGFSALLDKRSLNGVSLMKDVRRGDVFEVEVENVDAFRCVIYVKALRKLERVSEVEEGDEDLKMALGMA